MNYSRSSMVHAIIQRYGTRQETPHYRPKTPKTTTNQPTNRKQTKRKNLPPPTNIVKTPNSASAVSAPTTHTAVWCASLLPQSCLSSPPNSWGWWVGGSVRRARTGRYVLKKNTTTRYSYIYPPQGGHEPNKHLQKSCLHDTHFPPRSRPKYKKI